MAAVRARLKSIDQYIAQCAPEVRAALRKLRSTIKRAAPAEIQESIRYGIPAFTLHGIIIYFAAFKNHIGVFPPLRGNPKLKAEAAKYAGAKGNLKFPLDQPIPYTLVAKIVEFRVKQSLDAAKMQAKS